MMAFGTVLESVQKTTPVTKMVGRIRMWGRPDVRSEEHLDTKTVSTTGGK